ncbi:MAG: TerC family protein [Bacteroidetes bacterium]|nr:TerC family protein [Bacteroidota bacterium]
MEILDIFFSTAGLVSLFTLTLMEIILGIDNIIFISIVAGKLPENQQGRARTLGLMLALVFRIALLLSINWIVQLTDPIALFASLPEPFDLSWRDLILVKRGIFLMFKTIMEMHHKLEGQDDNQKNPEAKSFSSVIIQIALLDVVFSFDSILTAVGLADHVEIMIAAVVVSMGIMMVAAKPISDFINERPTMKMLALSFLLLIGFMLVAEGFGQHVDKGYIYFAMGFAFIVELLKNRIKKNEGEPVELRTRIREND